jgi:hypothetical protein
VGEGTLRDPMHVTGLPRPEAPRMEEKSADAKGDTNGKRAEHDAHKTPATEIVQLPYSAYVSPMLTVGYTTQSGDTEKRHVDVSSYPAYMNQDAFPQRMSSEFDG